jgi:hypothetical protein
VRKIIRQRGADTERHHVGTVGDIISDARATSSESAARAREQRALLGIDAIGPETAGESE